MAIYEVTSPEGSTFEVTAPDTASEADVLAYAKAQWAAQAHTDGKGLTNDQRLAVLKAQRDDPTRNPDSTPELEREIARLEKQVAAPYGLREDGTPKGKGYFGELKRPDGDISTELSFDTTADGKRIFGPLLVPTLSRDEIDHLLAGGKPTPAIYDKATRFALDRIKAGKSPFADAGEQVPLPQAVVRASQADVRKAEPSLSPMAEQRENERVFKGATERYMKDTGRTGLDIAPSTEPAAPAPNEFFPGRRPAPGGVRQMVEQSTGMTDPNKTREQAGVEELRQGGDVAYGDSLPYGLAKGTAAVLGFAGGPAGATAAESLVRTAAIYSNLQKAIDAGAIDPDQAVNIGVKALVEGVGEDALFNFGVPLLGELALKIPGVKPLIDKTIAALRSRYGAKLKTPSEVQAGQSQSKIADRAAEATSPAGKQAVSELASRMPGGEVPTPGQASGEASWWEGIARKAHPQIFGKQQEQLENAAEGLRNDLLNPAGQPTRQALGQQALDVVNDTERSLKGRLRPTFEAADNLGVHVDMQPVVDQARAALAKLERTNGHPEEITYLQRLIETLENRHPANMAGNPMVSAEDTLDMMSAFKEKLRSTTADWKPSAYFDKVMGDLVKTADGQYAAAASRAGKPDVVKNLLAARNDYREFMDTAYDDAFKTALKRQPEDIGRLFWQGGNVSEIQQFQKMLRIAQREGALGSAEAQKTLRDMTRGFLQEAVPTVEAASKWSETLAANPLKRDTWNALTSTPGGAQLKGTMELLEQAAKVAGRDSSELLQHHQIPLFVQRSASGSAGYSPVTATVRPGVVALAFSLTGLTRLAATAYTQGNKGVANLLMRALRASSAGTAMSAKAAEELKKYADENGVSLDEEQQ